LTSASTDLHTSYQISQLATIWLVVTIGPSHRWFLVEIRPNNFWKPSFIPVPSQHACVSTRGKRDRDETGEKMEQTDELRHS
jgi:hypothetical protein